MFSMNTKLFLIFMNRDIMVNKLLCLDDFYNSNFCLDFDLLIYSYIIYTHFIQSYYVNTSITLMDYSQF